jgi:hypothetical protein
VETDALLGPVGLQGYYAPPGNNQENYYDVPDASGNPSNIRVFYLNGKVADWEVETWDHLPRPLLDRITKNLGL